MKVIRSALFMVVMTFSTIVWVIPSLLARFFPYRICFSIISSWCLFNTLAAKYICGINYIIEGLENIPDQPCIIMSNHQSTWETLAFPSIFPTLAWVIKKELLYIPLFGWGIASTQPIALDRKQGKKALKQLIKDGREKLSRGRFILIFPEGTRIPYGETRPLKVGGFVLAKQSKADILPVAHDAGRLWPRKSFIKQPGTVHVKIGKPYATEGLSTDEISQKYAVWLEKTRKEIDSKSS